MKSIIEEIYNGTLQSFSGIKGNTPKTNEAAAMLIEAEQKIIKQYPECKDIFEEYLKSYSEYENYFAYEQFLNGFMTGAQLIIEIFSKIK